MARLNEHVRELPHDVTERLRVAREQAVQRVRLARTAQVVSGSTVGFDSVATLSLGGRWSNGWLKFASLLPVLVLVGGFLLIQHVHVKSQIATAAEIDAALLADDVPPAAYSDPGFVEFLKAPRD